MRYTLYMTTREKNEAALKALCTRLYDARTPQAERRELSMEVSMLRCRMMRTRDPLAKLTRASENPEEC